MRGLEENWQSKYPILCAFAELTGMSDERVLEEIKQQEKREAEKTGMEVLDAFNAYGVVGVDKNKKVEKKQRTVYKGEVNNKQARMKSRKGAKKMDERVAPDNSVFTTARKPRTKFNAINKARHEKQRKQLPASRCPETWALGAQYSMPHLRFIRAYKDFCEKDENGNWRVSGTMDQFMEHLYAKFDYLEDGEWKPDLVEAFLTDSKIRSKIKATKEKLKNDISKLKAKKTKSELENKLMRSYQQMDRWINSVTQPSMPQAIKDETHQLAQIDAMFGADEEW